MTQLANTERHYGTAAIALHWLMAALIAALVGTGIYMVPLPEVGFDAKKITLILIHKEIGMLALALAAARLAWRQVNPLPRLGDTLPEWQKVAAIFVHLCFYALMFRPADQRLGHVFCQRYSRLLPGPIYAARCRAAQRGPVRAAAAGTRLVRLRHGGAHLHPCWRCVAASFRAAR